MYRQVLFAFVVAASLVACDSSFTRPEPNVPDALAVTAILDPYVDTQAVALTKVANPLPDRQCAGSVTNATVRVEGVTFNERSEAPAGPPNRYPRHANYRSAALTVEPGSTYTLNAEKDQLTLSGTVSVPDTFRGWADGQRLFWTPSAGAARYQVHVEDAAETPFEFLSEYTVFDTSVVVGTRDEDFQSGSYYVEIAAQDSNLTAFMRHETDQAGVTGGYGVFGARTLIGGTVELARKRDTASKRFPVSAKPVSTSARTMDPRTP